RPRSLLQRPGIWRRRRGAGRPGDAGSGLPRPARAEGRPRGRTRRGRRPARRDRLVVEVVPTQRFRRPRASGQVRPARSEGRACRLACRWPLREERHPLPVDPGRGWLAALSRTAHSRRDTGDMTIKRLDHVSVVVDDLAAAIAFFTALGMAIEGELAVEGPWVDR